MTRKTALIVASVLALAHVVLACIYASVTPYRTSGVLLGQRDPNTGMPQSTLDVGAPDERQHANYVSHLLDGKGFPVLDAKDPNLYENYQSHQPPLFYLLEAGWVKLAGADPNSSTDGLKMRMLNTLIGGATVLGAFFLGLWGFRREDVGLVAAAFVALLPMNCALSGAVSNDPLLFCLCTWTLAVAALSVREGWTLKTALLCGLLTGLAILTKTTGIALLPMLLVAVFLSPKRPDAKQFGVCALALLVICAPWLARNQSLYGDPLGIKMFNDAFKLSASHETMLQVAAIQNEGKSPEVAYWTDWVGWWTARSFVGAFGYMDIFLNERGTPSTSEKSPNTFYRLFLALGVLVAAAWAFALKKPEWGEHKRVNWLLGTFLLVVLLLFLRFNAQYFQGQARYLFPAIAVFGIGAGIGVLNLCKQKWQYALGWTCAVLLATNAYALSALPGEFQKRTLQASANVLIGNDAEMFSV